MILISGLSLQAAAQDGTVLISKNAELSFFSTAPIENIDAKSNLGVSALNTKTGDIFFKVLITTFQFRNSLMQDHFNEDYLESDKYPYAEFKGKILENIDLTKDGSYPVTVQGQLTLHNVSKDYSVKGNLVVKSGIVSASSRFDVSLADHHIAIPRLVADNIAEVVQVSVSASYGAAAGK